MSVTRATRRGRRSAGRSPFPGAPILFALIPLLFPSPLEAQRPDEPPFHAVRDARIVTVSGRTIERGSLVLADGVITAVGTDVEIPPEARVLDGAGRTVYPGLFDALTTLGLTSRSGADREGGDASYSVGPEDRPATFTWVSAADELTTGDDRLEQWRSAGFTTALTVPDQGIFPGQAAVIDLAGERPNYMVVRTPVAFRLNLRAGRTSRGYPNSLMGVFAYIKQTFLDAAHYDRAWTRYEESPRGLERPAYDRALEPVRMAVRDRTPFLFPASSPKEIRRAVRTGGEAGFQPIIYGAQRAYEAPELLAENDLSALVSLDWPKAPRNGDPEAEPDLETLRLRHYAPSTPAALREAGVPFAFYSDGVRNPGDLLEAVRKAIDAGLSPEDAMRALTLSPAEIFGVADRLGSLEEGKIANVVVADGELFDADTKIETVFVDGERFDVGDGGGARTAAGSTGRAGAGARGAEEEPEAEEAEEEEAVPEPWAPVPMARHRGPYDTSPVTVIRNATIHTVTRGTIESGSLLIRDGKIAAVGTEVNAPRGARVIDAAGQHVTPGIIDSHSHIAADAINEGSISVSAMVGIEDVLDPEDIAIYRAAAGGVTTVNVLHGSANPIGGKNAVIKLRWGEDADGLLFGAAAPGLKFALGENPKRDRDPDRYPGTRMGVMDVIRQAFIEGRQYREEWREYERRRAAGERTLIPPRRDLKLETLAEIVNGERRIIAHAYRADEMLQLMRLAEEFGIRVTSFEHGLEGYKIAPEMAEHGAGGSTFSDWWAYKVEAYDAIPYNAAIMTRAGVTVSINSDSGEEMRHLNQEAAKTMKWGGMSEEEALRMVTLNPAKFLGVEDRVGSIEVGKDADLVIWNEHPLSLYAMPQKTFIDGKVYFDRELDRERRRAIEEEKESLQEKLQGKKKEPVVTDGPAPEEVR